MCVGGSVRGQQFGGENGQRPQVRSCSTAATFPARADDRAAEDEQGAVAIAGHDVRDVPRAGRQPPGPEGPAPQERIHPDLLLPSRVLLLTPLCQIHPHPRSNRSTICSPSSAGCRTSHIMLPICSSVDTVPESEQSAGTLT